MSEAVRRFGVFELESATGELRKRGSRIRLQEQPLLILEALLDSPGTLVTRDTLKEKLWPRDPAYRTDDNLNRAVRRLRDALGEGASEPRFIETIRHRGYRFLGAPEGDSGAARITTDTAFVGRRRELLYFRRVLDRALGGNGGVVLVGGEPGVGKTRLAQEVLAEGTQGGAQASFGRCYETEGTPPFIAFSELVERSARRYDEETLRELLGDRAPELARLVPELSRLLPGIPPLPALPPEMQRRNLFNGFLAFSRRWSSAAPLVLLIDDLHAADPATLALVDHLAEHLSSLPVLMLGTFRDTEVDSHPRFAETLHELVRKRLGERVSVPRFDETEVREILTHRYGKVPAGDLAERLHRFTDGNAFYLEEVLRDLGDDWDRRDWTIPDNVRLVTGRRLGRLSGPCTAILRAAAVIGRDFQVDLLEAMALEHVPDALEEATRAKIIRPDSDPDPDSDSASEARYVFEHELIRQSLLEDLSVPRRRRLHLEIGNALDRVAPHAVDERAHHLRNAGHLVPAGKLVETMVAASESAIEAAAAEDALQHANHALSLRAPLEPPLRARLHEARGMALWALERWEEGMGDWSEALALFESLADVEGITRVSRLMSIPLLWTGRFTEAMTLKARIEPLIGTGATYHRSLLLCDRAMGAWMGPASKTRLAMPAIEEAKRIAHSLRSPELEGLAGLYLGTIRLFREEHRLAAEEYERSVSNLRLEGKLYDLVVSLTGLQAAQLSLGDLAAIDAVAEEAASLSDRIGHRGARLWVDRHGAIRDAITTGELGPLKEHLVQRELGPALGDFARNWAYAKLGLAHFLTGDWTEAHDALERGVSLEYDNITRGYATGVRLLLGAYQQAIEKAAPPARAERARPEWAGRPRGSAASEGAEEATEHSISQQGLLATFREHAFLLPTPGEPARSGRWDFCIRSIEALAILDELDDAAGLYPAMEELTSRGGVALLWGETLIQKIAGIAAAAGGRWEAAERHFDAALRQASNLPFRIEQPEVRRWYAWMLRLRDGSGDRAGASAFLNEAVALYDELGMTRHAALARSGAGSP